MSRLLSIAAVAVVLSLPTQLIAGGPPRLCLPIDGVTADSGQECTQRLADALGERLYSFSGSPNIQLRQVAGRSYVIMAVRKDVKLSEIDAALKGSPFSVPREKLFLLGPVVLEFDADRTQVDGLRSGLAALGNVQVDAPKVAGDIVRVTLNKGDITRDFFRDELTADRRTVVYEELLTLAAEHESKLRDIRWSSRYGCRMFGCLSAAKPSSADKAVAVKRNGFDN